MKRRLPRVSPTLPRLRAYDQGVVVERVPVKLNPACGLRTDGSVTCWGIPLTLEP
jgi:hypothetical protein